MDEWKPTGVWDGFLIDLLTRTGLDTETVRAMSAQERIAAARNAAEAGRLDAGMCEALKRTGIVTDASFGANE